MKSDLSSLGSALSEAAHTGDSVLKVDNNPKNTSEVNDTVQELKRRHARLLDKSTEEQARLANGLGDLAALEKNLNTLETTLPAIKEELENKEPVSTEPEVLKKQLQDLQVRIYPFEYF